MYRASKIGASFAVMAAVVIAAPLSAAAQQGASMATPSSMSEAQSAPAGSQGAAGDSTAAFKAADERMMKSMQGQAYTGNADEDFVSHMIPHHQGAVDMAEVEAKYGKDPQLKRLAARIIESVDVEPVPLRMMLGSQALDSTLATLRKRIADFEAQTALAASTDFPPDA